MIFKLLIVAGLWSIGDVVPPKPDVPIDQPPQVRIIDTVRQTVSINGETITRIVKRYRDTGEMVAKSVAVKKKTQPIRIPIFRTQSCPT